MVGAVRGFNSEHNGSEFSEFWLAPAIASMPREWTRAMPPPSDNMGRKSQRGGFMRGSKEAMWGASKVRRIGVPGGLQINPRDSTRFIFRWKGTAFKAAFTSVAALLHVLVFALICAGAYFVQRLLIESRDEQLDDVEQSSGLFALDLTKLPPSVLVYTVNGEVTEAFVFILSFVIAQYVGFVVTRYSERLDIAIDAAEAASELTLIASVFMRSEKGIVTRLVRYTNLMLHLYYLSIDAPMSDDKWRLLIARELVTQQELTELERLHTPECAVHVWAIEVVAKAANEGKITDDREMRLEAELSSARRAASRQKDYHESPIPMPFFHLMCILSHAYLGVLEWNAGLRFGAALCDGQIAAGEILGLVVMIISVNTLRRIALAMTNPFGDDETDYELDYDLRRLWQEANETLDRMPSDRDCPEEWRQRAVIDGDHFVSLEQPSSYFRKEAPKSATPLGQVHHEAQWHAEEIARLAEIEDATEATAQAKMQQNVTLIQTTQALGAKMSFGESKEDGAAFAKGQSALLGNLFACHEDGADFAPGQAELLRELQGVPPPPKKPPPVSVPVTPPVPAPVQAERRPTAAAFLSSTTPMPRTRPSTTRAVVAQRF